MLFSAEFPLEGNGFGNVVEVIASSAESAADEGGGLDRPVNGKIKVAMGLYVAFHDAGAVGPEIVGKTGEEHGLDGGIL